jgi:hypothetical protein
VQADAKVLTVRQQRQHAADAAAGTKHLRPLRFPRLFPHERAWLYGEAASRNHNATTLHHSIACFGTPV